MSKAAQPAGIGISRRFSGAGLMKAKRVWWISIPVVVAWLMFFANPIQCASSLHFCLMSIQ
jgi:hypothetical protein